MSLLVPQILVLIVKVVAFSKLQVLERIQEQSSKIDSRLMSRPESSRGLHNGGITWLNATRYWTMTVPAWWSKSPQGARNCSRVSGPELSRRHGAAY